ncbi:MAG: CPBP family intramembrane metalloprotease [Acidobacteriota bacterium]|nr:CPBP family intramembrane metalloprotease [Acidobacteriota bacterium]MDH3522600.1 CPBP family intramembrane metalloprotease [Acidobacteriota bacterium]
MPQPLALMGTMVLSLAGALAIDWLGHRAGLTPPGFVVPEGREARVWGALVRRSLAIMLLAAVLWLGVFGALATLGAAPPADLTGTGVGVLFLLHLVFAAAIVLWYLLGFAGFRSLSLPRVLGLETASLPRELLVGLGAGVGAWVVVIAVLLVVGLVIVATGGEDALPREPPAMIPWIAGLPIAVRLAVSLSAGFFEELFFRGFLQPRTGVALSTALFVLAHANYEQPLMLVGIALLSLIFAQLVRWRRNIWPAIVAHALFDAVQLLVVVPMALEFLERGEAGPWLPIAGLG